MAACTRDADCRATEGYVCDRQWSACVMPNSTSIVPRTCPAPRGIGRDPAFAPTTVIADANQAAAIVVDGKLVSSSQQKRDPSLVRVRGTYVAARATNEGVVIETSSDAASWSQPTTIDPCTSCSPKLVAGGEVVFALTASEGLRVRASRDAGKTWSAPVTALAAGYGNAVVGGDGRLHVVGIDGGPLGAYGSAHQRVLYTVSTDGGRSFARAIVVSRRDEVLPFYFSNPSIAVDPRRKRIYIAYVRGGRDGVWDLVLATSKNTGATWTRTRIGDDPPCAIHMVPNLALDPRTGTLHVAWYDGRGEHGRFAHATCTVGLAKCTQVGRINDVPFASLSTVRHHATWIGDAATLVVDDARRELHAVWTQPVGGLGGAGIARVFHAKAKLPVR